MAKPIEAMTKPELIEEIKRRQLSTLSKAALAAKHRGTLLYEYFGPGAGK